MNKINVFVKKSYFNHVSYMFRWGKIRAFLKKSKSDFQMYHSELQWNLVQSQNPATKPTQGWSACFKDSKNVLHEIPANRAWKGRAK